MPLTFDALFHAATGGNTPYGYQRRLASGERTGRSDQEWQFPSIPLI